MTAVVKYDVTLVPVGEVYPSPSRRAVDMAAVTRLAESIKSIGLQTPITVRIDREYADPETGEVIGGFPLIAGNHRLEAFKLLGYEDIPAVVRNCDEVDARLWEISENLHRNDLTVLERSEQVAEWIALTDRKLEEQKANASQVATHKKRGQQEGGINAASRELGISKDQGHRGADIASLPDEAKQLARETGLDDNQSALLAAARAAKSAVKTGQDRVAAAVDAIKDIATRRSAKRENKSMTADKALELMAKDIVEAAAPPWAMEDEQFSALCRAWGEANGSARARFLEWANLSRH